MESTVRDSSSGTNRAHVPVESTRPLPQHLRAVASARNSATMTGTILVRSFINESDAICSSWYSILEFSNRSTS